MSVKEVKSSEKQDFNNFSKNPKSPYVSFYGDIGNLRGKSLGQLALLETLNLFCKIKDTLNALTILETIKKVYIVMFFDM